jgi:hypothetical protein
MPDLAPARPRSEALECPTSYLFPSRLLEICGIPPAFCSIAELPPPLPGMSPRLRLNIHLKSLHPVQAPLEHCTIPGIGKLDPRSCGAASTGFCIVCDMVSARCSIGQFPLRSQRWLVFRSKEKGPSSLSCDLVFSSSVNEAQRKSFLPDHSLVYIFLAWAIRPDTTIFTVLYVIRSSVV